MLVFFLFQITQGSQFVTGAWDIAEINFVLKEVKTDELDTGSLEVEA